MDKIFIHTDTIIADEGGYQPDRPLSKGATDNEG